MPSGAAGWPPARGRTWGGGLTPKNIHTFCKAGDAEPFRVRIIMCRLAGPSRRPPGRPAGSDSGCGPPSAAPEAEPTCSRVLRRLAPRVLRQLAATPAAPPAPTALWRSDGKGSAPCVLHLLTASTRVEGFPPVQLTSRRSGQPIYWPVPPGSC